MKRILIALTLAPLALAASAEGSRQAQTPEAAALRGECAAKYSAAYKEDKPRAANEYHFVYANAKYKGEQMPGKMLACTEDQYAAYLDSADPARVMSAYPTAAGRPASKTGKK